MTRTLTLFLAISIVIPGCCKPRTGETCNAVHFTGNLSSYVAQMEIKPVTTPISGCPNSVYVTGNYTARMEVKAAGPQSVDYSAIIGPSTKVALLDDGSLYVCEGWVYVWHVGSATSPTPTTNVAVDIFPWVQSEHIVGGAEGSAIAIRVTVSAMGDETVVYGYKGRMHGRRQGGANLSDILDSNLDKSYYLGNWLSTSSTGLGTSTSNPSKERDSIKAQSMSAGAPDPSTT